MASGKTFTVWLTIGAGVLALAVVLGMRPAAWLTGETAWVDGSQTPGDPIVEAPADAPADTRTAPADTPAETLADTGTEPPADTRTEPPAAPTTDTDAVTTDGALGDTAAIPEPAAEITAAEPAAQSPIVPRIDEVRVEPDGLSVVAGRAAPSSQVILFVDDAEVARLTTDPSGNFAALAQLDGARDGSPRVLSLAQVGPDGQTVPSDATVILAPLSQPASEPGPDAVSNPSVAQAGDGATGEPADNTLASAEDSASADTTTARTADPTSDPAPDQTTAQTPDQTTPQAPDRIAVLTSDAEGVRVLAPPGEAALADQVALDAISYSDTGDLRLQGRARDGADQVRVYLDNRPVATLPVTTDGDWRGDLPDIDAGVFTLRLDEVDRDGRVTSRIETPLKREDPGLLQSALGGDSAAPIKAITVQEGNTLWAIARDRYGEGTLFVRVFEANRDAIRDPDLIYPGQVLNLPSD